MFGCGDVAAPDVSLPEMVSYLMSPLQKSISAAIDVYDTGLLDELPARNRMSHL